MNNIMENKKVNDDYILEKKLESGSFGDVYLGIDIKTNEKLAFKIEEKKRKSLLLEQEYKIYRKLNKAGFDDGLPKIYKYLDTADYNILVLELLDKSLESIFNNNNKKFTMSTILLLGISIINLLEKLHKAGYIHRDIKPNNFMIGCGNNKNKLYVMDFGLSKRYIINDRHIAYNTDKKLIGTARYASVNIHIGSEPSRRDDMESVGYMLIYFSKGKLPWQGLKKQQGVDHMELIGDTKLCTGLDKLCKDLPPCFKKYVKYCRDLKFPEEPNYQYLRSLFIDTASELKIDLKYEWKI